MSECDIFMAALDIASAERRSAYLDQACGSNRMLRMRIEALLASHSVAGSLLEHPAIHAAAAANFDPIAERPGATVGPYKLLEQIGEGGMGVVYMAEQCRPVQRTVALKLIKAGMDSRQVMARFAAEKQALALMDHPNIAKVLDAGVVGAASRAALDVMTEDAHESPARLAGPTGRQYFVMELVDGIPITQYCDAHRLSPRARLELFVQICQAVQHAHQKGIIHRDLKPSNVLVALCDGRPVPKIIDFGVAKATGPKLTEATLVTELGQVVGTLEYMSPEQADLDQTDVDTRSDIYSLGILLYELLTGTTPLERQRLKETSLLDGLRIIREEEPPRPSSRLTASEALPTIAANRGLEPKRLSAVIRGDLDWIAMKCLEKDRDHRYETASSLASDIERYLRDEPVLACPPSAAYRYRKFARKHRPTIAIAVAFATMLMVGVIVSTSLAIRASQATAEAKANEQRALENERAALANAEKARRAANAERKARQNVAVQRQRAEAISKSLLSVARLPELARNDRISEILARAAREVQEEFDDSPTKGDLLHIIAESYYGLGLYREAVPLWEELRDYLVRTFGPDHPTTLAVSGNLAIAYKRAGRPDEAHRLFEETFERMRRKLGADHQHTRITMIYLAESYRKRGRIDEALSLSEDALKIAKAKLKPDHPHTLWAKRNLAAAYMAAARSDEALPLYEEMLERRMAKLGPDHRQTRALMRKVATTYATHGRFAQAAGAFGRAFSNDPDDHGHALRAAVLSLAAGDRGRYEAVCQQMFDRFAASRDGRAAYRTSLACLISSPPLGDIRELVRLADRAVATYKNSTDLAASVVSCRTRGLAAYRAGDFPGALKWCEESRALEKQRDNYPHLATNLIVETMAFHQQGKQAEAQVAFDESARLIQGHYPDAPANLGADWFDWLLYDLLRREATELLGLDVAGHAAEGATNRDPAAE